MYSLTNVVGGSLNCLGGVFTLFFFGAVPFTKGELEQDGIESFVGVAEYVVSGGFVVSWDFLSLLSPN